jgi:hypothetical protein
VIYIACGYGLPEVPDMRIFIDAVIAAAFIAVVAAVVLNLAVQRPVGVAFSSDAVRLDKSGS